MKLTGPGAVRAAVERILASRYQVPSIRQVSVPYAAGMLAEVRGLTRRLDRKL